ncbi:MAG: hypothetical protein LC637_02635 [Xanthomonadaceae bacterium]|nr:hypothetical protein [Xanthomonadaceae bacterium]
MKSILFLLATIQLTAGCAEKQQNQRRTDTLDRYEATIRWSQYDALVDFMHPDWLEENPVASLDIDRLHQFRVSQYRVRQVLSQTDGSGVDRVVELRMYHLHSARERTVEYLESWRWDEERERWMLHSGLPDVTSAR